MNEVSQNPRLTKIELITLSDWVLLVTPSLPIARQLPLIFVLLCTLLYRKRARTFSLSLFLFPFFSLSHYYFPSPLLSRFSLDFLFSIFFFLFFYSVLSTLFSTFYFILATFVSSFFLTGCWLLATGYLFILALAFTSFSYRKGLYMTISRYFYPTVDELVTKALREIRNKRAFSKRKLS
jgi:hypothetical protein